VPLAVFSEERLKCNINKSSLHSSNYHISQVVWKSPHYWIKTPNFISNRRLLHKKMSINT